MIGTVYPKIRLECEVSPASVTVPNQMGCNVAPNDSSPVSVPPHSKRYLSTPLASHHNQARDRKGPQRVTAVRALCKSLILQDLEDGNPRRGICISLNVSSRKKCADLAEEASSWSIASDITCGDQYRWAKCLRSMSLHFRS